MKTFRYCQSQIEDNGKCETQCEHCKEYYAPLENEPKGAGVGGESKKENFIDSDSIDSLTKEQYDILYDIVYKDTERLVINEYNKIIDSESEKQRESASVDSSIDWMYNWIRKHSNR